MTNSIMIKTHKEDAECNFYVPRAVAGGYV